VRIVSVSVTGKTARGGSVGVAEREGIERGGILGLKVSADGMRRLVRKNECGESSARNITMID
jgi:hypothetical protein